MEKTFKIAYLPLTKANWSNPELEKARRDSCAFLAGLPGVEVICGERMIDSEESAMAELERCEKEHAGLVVAQFMTFALGVVLPRFSQSLRVPVLMWTLPEPDPKGGRLQRNSFCAANMNAHFLYRIHAPYFHVHGNPGTAETASAIERDVRITKVLAQLRKLKIGSIGGRVPGFFTSNCDEVLLRRFLGPEVIPLTELEAVTLAKNLSASELKAAKKTLLGDAKLHKTDAPTEAQFDKSAALFAAIRRMAAKNMLDAVTLRCWPEVIADEMFGITLCSTIGHLNNHGLLTVCEGDIYAAATLFILRELSGEAPFFCDIISLDGKLGTVWHCGAAPCSMCKPGFKPEIRRSSTVGGGGVKGCVCEFPLKPGRVTVARIGEKRDGGGFRMLILPGEGVNTDLFVRGNPLNIRFDAGNETIRKELIDNGWEHHFSLGYGDLTAELLEICRILEIEPTILR